MQVWADVTASKSTSGRGDLPILGTIGNDCIQVTVKSGDPLKCAVVEFGKVIPRGCTTARDSELPGPVYVPFDPPLAFKLRKFSPDRLAWNAGDVGQTRGTDALALIGNRRGVQPGFLGRTQRLHVHLADNGYEDHRLQITAKAAADIGKVFDEKFDKPVLIGAIFSPKYGANSFTSIKMASWHFVFQLTYLHVYRRITGRVPKQATETPHSY